MVRKKLGKGRKNRCRFCTKEGCPRPAFVDYKDVAGMKKMCTSQGKLFSRKRSGNCAAFQRAVKDAIKRARFIGIRTTVPRAAVYALSAVTTGVAGMLSSLNSGFI